MSFARLPVALAMVVAVGVSGFFLWRQHGELQRVRAELAAAQSLAGEIEKLRAELERLAADNRRLKADAVDPNELARLRAGLTELNRLKAEKAALEKKLADAEAARVRMAEEATSRDATATPATPKKLLQTRATVAMGRSIITRAWTLPDGRQGFALLTPLKIGTERATFHLQVIAAPESPQIDVFLRDQSPTSLVASEEDLRNIVHTIYSKGGAAPLAMMEFDGNYLPSDSYMNVPAPENLPYTIQVSPQLAADGQSLDLGFNIQERESQPAR